ncbi:hypothetical protein [Bradyrhizobium sp. 150]|uniref:hypothetical protein n=1 Tax=Bradyrhizobium sp. 150 TaxID=2782625 RepID=UPI001FFA9642|nr:hypothetical protein [Bradyrhizobium sp. 150]MCK1670289.1 hypothetical protein [Bradyrhizobium sp. 150]
MWSDLLVALGGSDSYKTMSEEQMLAAIRNTYGGSVSALTTSESDLLASIVGAAGGSASVLTQDEEQMLAALLSALGGSGSALTSPSEVLLAAIIIQREGGGGGEPTSPTAKSIIDFVTGSYYAGGASRSLTDVIGTDAETGGTLDPSDVIGGFGLRGLQNGGTTTPNYIGPLLSDMLSDSGGVTVLFEITAPASPNGDAMAGFDFFNSPAWDTDMTLALASDTGNFTFSPSLSTGLIGGTIPPDQAVLTPYAAGLCRVAITGTPDSIAISVNGGNTARFSVSPPFPFNLVNKAYFGNSFNADYLRSIKVYAPQNDATMKTLSAL